MADQISVSKNEIKQYYEAEVSLVLRHERRHSSCMDPFEASLLSPPNNESDTSGSTGRVIDAKDLIDEQRWQEFAKWQLERYKAVESANVAQRWADMNGLNLDGSRKTAQNHVQAKIHAQFPQNIPAQQDPQTAELSDKGAPAKESAPSKKRNRGIGKEMPVMLAGQTDLFAAPPSTSSRKAPAALPGTIKRSAKTRASTSKLFQPLESSSDEDEHAATEFKTAHTAGPPLKRNRRNSAEKSDFVVKPTDTSSRLSVKSTASSVSKPKLIKAMSLPEGRQMYSRFPNTSQYVTFLNENKVALFDNYRKSANDLLLARSMSGSVTDAGLLRDAAAATTSNPDINGIFAGLNVLLVTPTKSLMDLANGHIHIRSLISRGASVVDHVSSDQEVMPAVSLSSFSHFIVFGPAQSWKLNTVADLIGFTERETLTAGIKVVSSDWVGHSVREGCLAPTALDEIFSSERARLVNPPVPGRHDTNAQQTRKPTTVPHPPLYEDTYHTSSCSQVKLPLDVRVGTPHLAPIEPLSIQNPATSTPAFAPKASTSSFLPDISISLTNEKPNFDDLGNFLEEARREQANEEQESLMGATRLDDAEELQERQEPIASTSRRTISALEDEHMILSKHNPQYDSGDDGSDEAAARCHQDEQTLQRKSKEGYQCERKNEGGHNVDGVNEDICQGLEELRVYFEGQNDPGAHWRQVSLQRAIGKLRNSATRIDTYDKAIALKGVGEATAQKIDELGRTGKLRRNQMMVLPEERYAATFAQIYGVGPAMARKFVLAGARTFEDLQPGNKFNIELNRAQSLGLKHYDDLHERIPRDEVQAVRNVIEEAAGKIDPKVEVYVMGSFRRQAPTCGDIDIIFTRTTADGQNHAGFIKRLCAALKQSGLIIDDLTTPTDWEALDCKYMGLCQLNGGRVRHLDLLAVPEDERGAALIYFTGNDIFNRSLRLKARHAGMSLNQRGLFKDLYRKRGTGEKLTEGTKMAGRTEQDIFDLLNVEWRPPHHRVP